MDRIGIGHERTYETKPYEFGDPFNLHIERTVRNAMRRAGGGTPVRLTAATTSRSSTPSTSSGRRTVLMLDLSLSMPMRDNFLPAKKVAMALHSLISIAVPPRLPRHRRRSARWPASSSPSSCPRCPGTSSTAPTCSTASCSPAGCWPARRGTKQIIMITDGEPTAHIDPSRATPFFNYPPVRETVDATLREVDRCTRDGIRINTFMLDATPHLQDFVEKLTEMNRGRAFFTTPETLGDYVLVDFIEQRARCSAAAAPADAVSGPGVARPAVRRWSVDEPATSAGPHATWASRRVARCRAASRGECRSGTGAV